MHITTNSWQNFTLVCGNHPDDHSNEMTLKKGPHSLFYSCPKYLSIYKHIPGRSCNNRINLVDYERMLNHLNAMAASGNGIEDVCLKGYRFKDHGIEYEVLEHKDGKFRVSMLNKKAIARV